MQKLPDYKPFNAKKSLQKAADFRWKVLGRKMVSDHEENSARILQKARENFHKRKSGYDKSFTSRRTLKFLSIILKLREMDLSYRVIAQYLHDKHKFDIDVRVLNSFTNRVKASMALNRVSPVIADALKIEPVIDYNLLGISEMTGGRPTTPASDALLPYATEVATLLDTDLSYEGITEYLNTQHKLTISTRVVGNFANIILLAKKHEFHDPGLKKALKGGVKINTTLLAKIRKVDASNKRSTFERSGAADIIDMAPEIVALSGEHTSSVIAKYLNSAHNKTATAAAVSTLTTILKRNIQAKKLTFSREPKINHAELKKLGRIVAGPRDLKNIESHGPEIAALLKGKALPSDIFYYLKDVHGVSTSRKGVIDFIERLPKRKYKVADLPKIDTKRILAEIRKTRQPAEKSTHDHLLKHENTALNLMATGFRSEGINIYLRDFLNVDTDIALTRAFLSQIPTAKKKEARGGVVEKPETFPELDLLKLERATLQDFVDSSTLAPYKDTLLKWDKENINPSQIKEMMDEISPGLAARNTIISYIEKFEKLKLMDFIIESLTDARGYKKRGADKTLLKANLSDMPLSPQTLECFKSFGISTVGELADASNEKTSRLRADSRKVERDTEFLLSVVSTFAPNTVEEKATLDGLVTSLTDDRELSIGLLKIGIVRIRDLVNTPTSTLSSSDYIGKKGLSKLKRALKKQGLSFAA